MSNFPPNSQSLKGLPVLRDVFRNNGTRKQRFSPKVRSPIVSRNPKRYLARKQQALGATPTTSTGLVGSLGFGGSLYRFDYVSSPASTVRRMLSHPAASDFCHISALLLGLQDSGRTVWGVPRPSPAPGECLRLTAHPHGDGWVAPVLQGQGQQLTMVVMTKLTPSQAGFYDYSEMVDLVI